jgi:hypothetical protein
VVIQNYLEGKLNSHNFIDYFYRLFFLLITEILFDWIKDIIIFKISLIKAKYLKSLTLELAVFHDKMKYNCFNINNITNGSSDIRKSTMENSDEGNFSLYLSFLDDSYMTNLNQENLEKYLYYIDYENLMTIELQHNVLVICIVVSILFRFILFYLNLFKFILFKF